MLVTACCMQVTNQRVGKQCAVICAEAGAFYGRRAEVSLADYFLARGVTGMQSGWWEEAIIMPITPSNQPGFEV